MADPQKENGFTAIANEIMDALCHIRIPGEERQILDCILRKSYGWNKCEDAIALTTFSEMTGIKKPAVVRAINGLLSKKIITVIEKDNAPAKVYKFNKNYDEWKPLSKKITLSKKIISVIKKDNSSLSKKSTSKDNPSKDNTKDKPIIPEWVPTDTFAEYQEARHKKLKPASFDRFFKKLKRLADESRASPEQIMAQSIENGWEGIFNLKAEGGGKGGMLSV